MRHPTTAIAALTLLLAPAVVSAQAGHDHDAHASPYAGEVEARDIRALSPEEVRGLLEGEGLGFALAAELNRVPGPRHVLEMAGELGLDGAQRDRVEAIRVRMAEEARALGARLVEEERHLDRMFARGHATAEGVRARTAAVARIRGELRAVHLTAHLETEAALTPEQVAAYRRLRGYGTPSPEG